MKKCLLAALAAAVFCGVLLSGCSRVTTLDLLDYAHFETNGRDGEATAEVVLDTDALDAAVMEAVGLGEDALKADTADNTWLRGVVDSISFNLSKTEGIANGDAVTVSAELAAANAASSLVQFKFDETTVTVTGLEDTIHLDPFENLFVSFSGIEPNIHIEFSAGNAGGADLGSSFGYAATPATALSAGSSVVISATCLYDDATLAAMGYTVDTYQRIYTVPDDVDRYAASWQELSANALAELLRDAQNEAAGLEYENGALPVYSAAEYLTDARDLSPTDFTLGNTFFTVRNTPATAESAQSGESAEEGAETADTSPAPRQNRLAVIFSCNVTGSEGAPTACYGAVFLDNIAVDSDGDISLDLDPEISVSPLYLDIPDLMAQQLGYDQAESTQIYFTQEQWAADIEAAKARDEAAGKTVTLPQTGTANGIAEGSAGGSEGSTPMLEAPRATALPKLDHIG